MHETILLTGATGYIASHTWVELLNAGYQVVGLDNLCHSRSDVLARIERITAKAPRFVQGDVRDRRLLDHLLASERISAVIHFAARKSISESVQQPLAYYDNNLCGLVTLCAAMAHANVWRLVFSSSATVYGHLHAAPITEASPLSATNPYGWTKLMGEQVLHDLALADAAWQIACLRYFNPAGAHSSGLMGEDPRGVPSNLMPYIAQVAAGQREKLSIFGGDWPTADGTGVRDYLHVMDLARGHLSALDALRRDGRGFTVNLGTGRGYSVLEIVTAYQRASGRPVPYEIVGRRPGDVAVCYAEVSRAASLLGWRAQYGIERMCEDSWRWQSMNPERFQA